MILKPVFGTGFVSVLKSVYAKKNESGLKPVLKSKIEFGTCFHISNPIKIIQILFHNKNICPLTL